MQLSRVCLVALLLVLACATQLTFADEAIAVPTDPAPAAFTDAEQATLTEKAESFEFQAEVHRLMDIIINSLYSKREIFLRELISNSADALDKIKYLTLTNQTTLGDNEKLEVRISFDRDAKTLTIRDTGVGMSREELKRNLGIVAKSGTTDFVEAAAKGTTDLSLIGQFGVGFYSVYLAADKVTVVSKSVNDTQHVWESMADKTFTIAEDPRGNTLGRGTQVTLHLKEDALEFANEHELKKLVKRYSEFINYPIFLQISKSVEKEVPDEEAQKVADEARATREAEKAEKEAKKAAGEETAEGDEEVEVSDEDEAAADDKPKTKKVQEQVSEWERVNNVKAIWTRAPRDITDEEYNAFFKTLSKDEETEPLQKIHFTAEGEITFRAILYCPSKAPHGLYDKFYEKQTALRLYVRRVLISDEFDDFLPRYLNFIKGVVDSEDLPLNVSRETLAQSRVLKVMAKKITRKVLEMLKKMADAQKKAGDSDEEEEKTEEEKAEEAATPSKGVKEEDQYGVFYKEFGKSIKLGVIDDRANKAKLAKLLRYETTKSEGKQISLEEYVDRMGPKQKSIYYITGENLSTVKNSPFLERLVSKGLEVVYMVDALDEYVVQTLTEFDGTPLQAITKEGLKLGDEDKLAKQKEELKPLTDWLAGVYGDRVEKVTVSNRIAKSPCVLVSGQFGWSANMERIMKAQTFANADEATWLHSKKTMEVNPRHPIIKELASKVTELADKEGDEAKPTQLVDLANLLYDSALLSSGFQMRDTADFSKRIQRVISNGLSIDPTAEAEPETEDADAEDDTDDSAEDAAAAAEPVATEEAHDEL